ncbi:ROK family transcriptional regulator [Streptomyces roseirectus]|uniref:ROK family transcriptional regulator n=1 Tax=Streptomyces roseirectus TaxID=2768066 RepID=A0A7H0II82_9ACTN|nr:ROK family transcriptional regulator [Streptomyces roseirectus]QNP72498.1 ROK family transcriptional regulator [Streptomyces roseirectus]
MNRTNDPARTTGTNLLAVRGHNTALVLDLLRTAGADGISRLELAERTGLTPQAVSKITARLREDGLATEAGYRASTGGKPRTVLRLVPGAGHAVGVHLDRDELRVVLVRLDGRVVAERRTPLDLGAGTSEVVGVVVREVQGALADGVVGLLGVGIALPGPLDHTRGVLGRVTGFPDWDGFPLRDVLARALDVPVVVDKDTNAAALGLAVAGEGDSAAGDGDSFAYLHLGTGLGAGLVIHGTVHRGARTGAGEFGHQVVLLDGPACPCGRSGCIEVLCLTALARGDLAEAARVLGVGAANLVGLLDIDQVLLGGRRVTQTPQVFVDGVSAVVGEVPVRVADSGVWGVAAGAAQLLLGAVFGRG